MKKITLLLIAMVASLGLFAQDQQILSYFSYNELDSAPNTQSLIMADGGLQAESSAMYLDGTNGSSSWTSASELNSFLGTSVNAMEGFVFGRDIALKNTTANGKSVVFKLSTTGFQGLMLTYAFRRTGTGFKDCVWAYSTDGSNFINADTKSYTSSVSYQVETVDMSGITALNEQTEVYVRLTVSGCTSASGNIRIDNVTFSANPGGEDVYPPHITNVSVTDSNRVVVTFNEDVDSATAETVANYTFDNGYATATATHTGNVVNLSIAPAFANGASINMFVQNVADVAGNVMAPDTFALVYGIAEEFMCADIATLRSKLDFTDNTIGIVKDSVEYKLTGSVFVTAVAGHDHQKVLQDETGAVLVYDPSNVLGNLDVDDEISGIYCTLTNYWGFLELVPTRPYEHFEGYFQTVNPQVITLSQLNDENYMVQHQAELIELDNVSITSSGNFAKLNRYDLAQNGVTAPALYPYFQDADYLTLPIPTGIEQNITGFNFATSKIGSSTFEFRYYIVPRFKTDMTGMSRVADYGKMQISVYPNPTANFVTLGETEATEAEIYDVNGKKVASQSVQNSNIVSLQGLSAGSYFLRLLKDNELVGTAKVIKR
jgi:hypothetical protein